MLENNFDREKQLELLTAYADSELGEDLRGEVEDMLARSEELRRELDEINKMKALTATVSLVEPEEEVWNVYWLQVYNRLERNAGWVVLSLGVILLMGYGAWHFTSDFLLNSEVSIVLRLGTGAVLLATIILLVSVLRERLFTRKNERYKEVVR
jgi:hypothetical protein